MTEKKDLDDIDYLELKAKLNLKDVILYFKVILYMSILSVIFVLFISVF